MKTYKVFLDDYRDPRDLYPQMDNEIYLEQNWLVVRSYEEFTTYIEEYHRRGAFPRFISFDSRIATLQFVDVDADSVELFVERTGADCAGWLADFTARHQLSLPLYAVHSAGEEGEQTIASKLRL